MKTNTCCFFGHRTIDNPDIISPLLCDIIEDLILNKNVDTFLFGSRSQFNDFCLNLITKLKEKYPHIKRIYVRAEYPYIDEQYKDYLLQRYEDTYYPQEIVGTGKTVYIKRNYEMINNSQFCVVYYDENRTPPIGKSGTKTALDYAKKTGKQIIILPFRQQL